MDNIITVLRFAISLLNYRLYFPPFSFTILQAFLGLSAISLVAFFVRKLFD